MTQFFRISILRYCAVVGLSMIGIASLGTQSVSAAAPLSVVFEATPLFLDADVKPGDSTTRTVQIGNGGVETESVYVTVQNTFNTGLADVMQLSVSDGVTTYFTGSFSDFFQGSPHSLGALPGSTNRTYNFVASLASSVGNEYQKKQFGFDLVVGFLGGPSVTDTPGGGGGGGGGGQSQSTFSLFNEQIDSIDVFRGQVVITWNTSRDATTYLVCGDLSFGPFILDPMSPRFGYQFVVPEVTTLKSVHSAELVDLSPGSYECRPASRPRLSDDFTVGIPLRFTIPDREVLGAAVSAPLIAAQTMQPYFPTTGSVMGASSKGAFGGPTYDEWRAEMEAERLAREAADATEAVGTSTRANETVIDSDRVSETDQSFFDRSGITANTARRYGTLAFVGVLLLGFWWYVRRR